MKEYQTSYREREGYRETKDSPIPEWAEILMELYRSPVRHRQERGTDDL